MRRLAAALALGLVIPAGARPAVLERVEVVEDGGPLVRLHVSEPVTPVAHALPAEGDLPARIYLDLPVTALLPAASARCCACAWDDSTPVRFASCSTWRRPCRSPSRRGRAS